MYSFLHVQGNFDAYLSSFGNMGRNLRRFRKKLEKVGHVSIEVRKGSAASEDLLPEFLALEASGWKGRNGTAILNDPNATHFYTTLVRNFPHVVIWSGIRSELMSGLLLRSWLFGATHPSAL